MHGDRHRRSCRCRSQRDVGAGAPGESVQGDAAGQAAADFTIGRPRTSQRSIKATSANTSAQQGFDAGLPDGSIRVWRAGRRKPHEPWNRRGECDNRMPTNDRQATIRQRALTPVQRHRLRRTVPSVSNFVTPPRRYPGHCACRRTVARIPHPPVERVLPRLNVDARWPAASWATTRVACCGTMSGFIARICLEPRS